MAAVSRRQWPGRAHFKVLLRSMSCAAGAFSTNTCSGHMLSASITSACPTLSAHLRFVTTGANLHQVTRESIQQVPALHHIALRHSLQHNLRNDIARHSLVALNIVLCTETIHSALPHLKAQQFRGSDPPSGFTPAGRLTDPRAHAPYDISAVAAGRE